jgi:hypothetical protein
MLPKTAVDKESVDQKELVNATLDITRRIVQLSAMQPKTAVVKEPVDQMEHVSVNLPVTGITA